MAVPYVSDAGSFSDGPLTRRGAKPHTQRIKAEEGNIEREMGISKSTQVESLAAEVDGHFYVGEIGVPPLIFSCYPVSTQHLFQLLAEPFGLTR